ncbi:MAG: M28 family peptidase, partial [Candidatus Aminicenantes bacterium]
MTQKKLGLLTLALLLIGLPAAAQMTPWLQWTFLPQALMDEIVGEASGETAMNHVMAMCGFPRDRKSAEYAGTFAEAQYVLDRLKEAGLPEAAILRFPGGETWDGVKGELWEVKPGREKIASYTDLTAMLASGSASADVTAELVWVEEGEPKDFEGLEVKDKILVTSGSAGQVHNIGFLKKGAAGVISFASPRPLFDPLLIPWGGLYVRGSEAKFAFMVPPREGVLLRDRLKRGEKITVHAVVEAKTEKAELQDIVAAIPGTDAEAQEVIVTAHIFEGYAMFGANDNSSGSSAILEAARTLQTLIAEGRLPRPKRTIRFLWAPEFSGTIPYVKSEPARMARTLCDINLDMVGDRLSRSLAFFTVMRTTYGHPHYINDVLENYFRYVGEATRSYVTNGMDEAMARRIVAPSGSEE